MIRKIININEKKCNGCGSCANACHEGAIEMVNGKAKLIRDDYCDGMGDCLPECPTGAITFELREADAYDEQAVAENKKKFQEKVSYFNQVAMCPGSRMREIKHTEQKTKDICKAESFSALCNWPVQIKLAPIVAPYFNKAKLLIAADCTAYAYSAFHQEFMRGKVTLIGCPKLDGVDYSEKLTDIIRQNDIKSVTVIRMKVPCCGGLEVAVKNALKSSGKFIPWQVVTVSVDGGIIE